MYQFIKQFFSHNEMKANPCTKYSIYINDRSLEPLTGLAMWSSEPQIIELIKGERGLGFSILDYQVR